MAGLTKTKRRSRNSVSKLQINPLLEEQIDIFFGIIKKYFMVVPNYILLSKKSSPNERHYNFIKKTILNLYTSLKFNDIDYSVIIEALSKNRKMNDSLHVMISFILDKSGLTPNYKNNLIRELENIIPGYSYNGNIGRSFNFNKNAIGGSSLQYGGFRFDVFVGTIVAIVILMFTANNLSFVHTTTKASANALSAFTSTFSGNGQTTESAAHDILSDQLLKAEGAIRDLQQRLRSQSRLLTPSECNFAETTTQDMCLHAALMEVF